jgi:hypothetical protein
MKKSNLKAQLAEKNKAGLEGNKYVSKFEKIGYKAANTLHKVGVLSLVGFIMFNIYIFGKEYNAYWRARRVILFKLES